MASSMSHDAWKKELMSKEVKKGSWMELPLRTVSQLGEDDLDLFKLLEDMRLLVSDIIIGSDCNSCFKFSSNARLAGVTAALLL
jgi:hypothetical protein